MAKHLSGRIRFEQVVAGFLRLIEEPGLFREIHPLIKPDLVYINDNAEDVISLRQVVRLMKHLAENNKSNHFSIKYIENEIPLKYTDEKNTKISQSYVNWTRSDEIKALIYDEGSFSAFLDYIKALQIFEIATEFGTALQKNNIDNAIDMMNGALSRISKIGAKDSEKLAENEALSVIEDDHRDDVKRRVLLLGNPLLDDMMGGFEQQTLNGFLSVSGGGKSMMCHHLIASCIEQNLRCWVGVLEDRKKSFVYRLMSRLTGIPIRTLKKDYRKLSSDDKAKMQYANELINKFVRVEFIYGSNVDAIHKAALDYDLECRMRDVAVPIVNIVDYTGHIAGNSYGDKMYEKMRVAYGARKDFALKNDKICFDFAQINREGTKGLKNNALITQESLAGAFDIVQIFDNLISINRSPEDIMQSKSRLHVCKARDSANNVTVSVGVDFSRAKYKMKEWDLESLEHSEALETKRMLDAKEKGGTVEN